VNYIQLLSPFAYFVQITIIAKKIIKKMMKKINLETIKIRKTKEINLDLVVIC
jgi:hypothetical protein